MMGKARRRKAELWQHCINEGFVVVVVSSFLLFLCLFQDNLYDVKLNVK